MNNFGFLVETIQPLPSKNKRNSFGKPKGRIPYMSKKDIISNFGKNEKKEADFGKKKAPKKKQTPAQRKAMLRNVMKTKKEKKVTLKEAWSITKKQLK